MRLFERFDNSGHMWLDALSVFDVKAGRLAVALRLQLDLAGQEDGQFELHGVAAGIGLLGFESRCYSRLGPHAVDDVAFEAEQSGAERVQVNRVAVTGNQPYRFDADL